MSERQRILVVDDEADIRDLFRRALPEYDVIQAADAESALNVLESGPVDLVITDIRLPQMDGCALAAWIQERWPDLPLVAISGYVEDRDIADFSFADFLAKPVQMNHLCRVVQDLLGADAN